MMKTFVCAKCKEGGCSSGEYTHPVNEIAGEDAHGRPICQECCDAWNEENVKTLEEEDEI